MYKSKKQGELARNATAFEKALPIQATFLCGIYPNKGPWKAPPFPIKLR